MFFIHRESVHHASPEVESRTQGSRPRPRTQKKSEAKAKDSLSEDRHSQGQERSRPRPRTQAQVLSKKKKKKVFTKIFQAISTKKRFPKNFSSALQNFNNSKNSAVLEPRTGQFSRTWGLEAKAKDLTFEAKAKDFKMCPRGLHLCASPYHPAILNVKMFPCFSWNLFRNLSGFFPNSKAFPRNGMRCLTKGGSPCNL